MTDPKWVRQLSEKTFLKTKIKNLHAQNDNLNAECKQMTEKVHNSDIWDDKSPPKYEKSNDTQQNGTQAKF